MNKIEEKIIQKGIMTKSDYEKSPEWARNFALIILKMSEDENFCSQEVSNFEIEKFSEEFRELQDLADMSSFDKVCEDFEEKTKSIKFGIPNKIIPYLRFFAIPELMKDYQND